MTANAARGEASIVGHILRPSFAALVAAEEELGPLFALVERAAAGELRLTEMVALFWHCLKDRPADLDRDGFGQQLIELGLAALTPPLKRVLGQILSGQ
jgi:hypothetical protein